MRIMNNTPGLNIHFPQTGAEILAAMNNFTEISMGAAISNCVGAIDGYLCRIKVPLAICSSFRSHWNQISRE